MTEKITLVGLTNIAGIMAFCATQKTHMSGGHRLS